MDEVLPPAAALMSAIYEEHKYVACTTVLRLTDDISRDEDGFLYVSYSGENTFGDR